MRASTQPPSRVVDFARSVFQGGVPEFWHWITKRRKSPPCKTLITFEYKHAAGTRRYLFENVAKGTSLNPLDPVLRNPRAARALRIRYLALVISFATAKHSDRRAGRDATSIGSLRSRACGRGRKKWYRRDPYFLFSLFSFFSATTGAAAAASNALNCFRYNLQLKTVNFDNCLGFIRKTVSRIGYTDILLIILGVFL